MRDYLIVETRDAADHLDAARTLELACGLARAGMTATILLTENGAFNAGKQSRYPVAAAIGDGVKISVDRFAVEERGIADHELQSGVTLASMDSVADHLFSGSCVLWR